MCSRNWVVVLALGLVAGAGLAADGPALPRNYKLVYEQNFEKESAWADFIFTDPAAWKMSKDAGGPALELFGKSKYEPKHRSPFNIALLKDRVLGDFILEAEVASTIKPYPHQDMCLFFGYEATNKFYYTHLAMRADPIKKESHAHDIFIVNDAPRLALATETTKGVEWGQDQWHKVRLERRVGDGSIRVFFDDMAKPIMVAEDKTFAAGYVGFGSFDDTGKFRHIRIFAPRVEMKTATFFPARN